MPGVTKTIWGLLTLGGERGRFWIDNAFMKAFSWIVDPIVLQIRILPSFLWIYAKNKAFINILSLALVFCFQQDFETNYLLSIELQWKSIII